MCSFFICMYQALYRKYRPQTFEDVIGQEHITESLKNQVESGRLSHAYIFIGTRGTGKTTCARILAKAVNCEHPVNGNPCGVCDSCRGIADGSVLDIVELDAASNNGVDNVRTLRDEAVFSPASVKKRVYIIDEVHMLSTPAFNALLKILEEPPEHLMFVLATTELQKVPATILSRCQRHTFKRIPLPRLSAYLLEIAGKEGIRLSEDAAALLAGLGEGSVRDALSMLDQCSNAGNIGVEEVYNAVGLAGNRRITALFKCIADKNPEEALGLFDTMWNDGKDPAVVIKELCGLARDVLMTKLAPRTAGELIYGGYDRNELADFASALDNGELLGIMDELTKTLSAVTVGKVSAELCLAKLCSSWQPAAVRAPAPARSAAPKSEAVVKPECPVKEAPVPEPAVPPTVPERSAEPTGEAADFWFNVCSAVKADVPFDVGRQLNNTDVVIGELQGDALVLQVEPSFWMGRFNRSDVLQAFTKAGSEIVGKPISVRVSELQPKEQKKLNLDDLNRFSEVSFVN